MSRSYKHTPRAGQPKDRFYKKYANRKVRRLPLDKQPKNGREYRKVFCHYDICDYETVGITFEEYWASLVKSWHRWKKEFNYPYPDREQAYQEYCRWFLRK